MEVKDHYDSYWAKKSHGEKFLDYERNHVLPQMFENGGKILDLGCGDGIVSEYLKKIKKMEVTAVDLSDQAVKLAKSKGITDAMIVDVEKKLPFNDGTFDYVFWGDNVEHLFDPIKVLKEINRILKKGGFLVLSCPNIGNLRYRLHFLLNGNLPDTEWTGNKPWQWSHIRFFNFKLMKEFLSFGKFNVISHVGVTKHVPDKYLLPISNSLFGMIQVVKAQKL